MAISTNGTVLARLAGGLYNQTLSNATYNEVVAVVKSAADINTLANDLYARDFASKTDLAVATTLVSNLGLSSIAGLNNWVSAQLTAAGAAGKGAKIVSLLNDLSNLTSDATYGSYATAFNAKTDAALALAQTAASKGGDFNAAATLAAAQAAADAAAAAAKSAADAAAKAAADKAAADAAAKVAADAAAAANAPQTFTLTTGIDTGSKFVGGAGDDTFNAVDGTASTTTPTWTSGDSLVGGAGTDTLTLAVSGTPGAAQVSTNGIETIQLVNNSAANAAYTVDATLMTGLTAFDVTGGTGAALVSNAKQVLNSTLTSVNNNVTLGYGTLVTAGAADVSAITLNSTATTADVVLTNNGVETLNVVTTGNTGNAALGFEVQIVDDKLHNLNISGAGNVVLTATLVGTSATDAGVVDASKATGSVNAVITAPVSSGMMSVTGGAGNDEFNVGTLTNKMTVAGGAGTDTLTVASAAYSSTATSQVGANVSGFEVIKTSGSIDMRALNGTSATVTEVQASAGSTVVVASAAPALTKVSTAGAATLTFDVLTDTAADALTLNLNSQTGAATTTGLTSTTVNTLAVVSGGNTGVTNTVTVDDAALSAITVTGDKAASITTSAATVALTSVDASAHTGATYTIDASSSNAAMTIKGSAGVAATVGATVNTLTGGLKSDSIVGGLYKDVIVGGAGNDTISGAGGNDNIDGGTGNDTITAADGDNTLTGGTGDDSITSGAGNDLIDAGSGNNTIVAGGGNDLIATTSLSETSSIDGGTGTDRLSTTTGTITATSASGVNSAFITVTGGDAAPTVTGVESIYVAFDSSAGTQTTPTVLDMTKVTGATSSTLFLEANGGAATGLKVNNFGGSTIKLYGATAGAAEDKFTIFDGIGQSSLTLSLEDYDAVAAGTTAVTGVSNLTIDSRSTSQFTGSADQGNTLITLNATGVDTLTVRTSGSAAANTTAFVATTMNATAATGLTLTAGANDYLVAGTVNASGANMQTMTLSTTAGTAAGGLGIVQTALGSAALTQVTINLADSTYMSTTGAAAGNAVDFDFTSAAKFDVTLNAGAGAEIDLTDEVITAGTFAIGTGATLQLTSGFGAGASSYVFTGRGDLDDAAGNNTFAIAGTTATFNTSGLTVDADALIITTSTTGASTITTGLGTDNITGGAGNDIISSGAAVDTITGGNGSDNLNGGAGADIIYADNAGTKRVETVTITYAVGTATDVITVNGVAVTFTTGADLAASKAAMIAAINGTAALANIVVASANAGAAIVDITYLVDGVTPVSVDTTSPNNTNTVAQVTAGTNGTANGNDVLTGGSGADVFVWGGSVGTGGNGAAPSATVLDTITDYTTGSDVINFRVALTLVAEGTSSATQGVVSATGLVAFHADTAATLAARLAATEAAMTAATATAGETAVFVVGSDSYVFVSDGTAGLGANDQLIKLTGVVATTGITLSAGDITAVA